MLNSNINYPYPLLRETAEDFQTAVFSGHMEVLRENKGFRIVPHFSVNNKQIQSYIKSAVLSYAIQIQCRSTFFRTVEYIKDNESLFIPGGQVHELVEICPCIIVMQDIEDYMVDDFVPAFKASSVKLFKGDVVGIGNTIRFRAYYKADEVKKANSVVTVRSDETAERISVDLNHTNIEVTLPKQQYEAYLHAGTSTIDQVTLLTGIVSVPVIAYALSQMTIDDEDSDFSERLWYRSLRALLDKIADGDPSRVETLLEDPFGTAQMMLGDNLSASLAILNNREW